MATADMFSDINFETSSEGTEISNFYTDTTSSSESSDWSYEDKGMPFVEGDFSNLPPLIYCEDLTKRTGFGYWGKSFLAGISKGNLCGHLTNAMVYSRQFLKRISWSDLPSVNESIHPQLNFLSYIVGPSIDLAREVVDGIANGYQWWKYKRTKNLERCNELVVVEVMDVMGIEAAVEPSYYPLMTSATLLFASERQWDDSVCIPNLDEGAEFKINDSITISTRSRTTLM